MQFPKFRQPEISHDVKQPKPSLQQTLADIRSHCSGFLQHITDSINQQQQKQPAFPFFNPNPSSLKTHFELALENLGNQAKRAFGNGIPGFGSKSPSSGKSPLWARVSAQNETLSEPVHRFDLAMSTEAIEERLSGVPVYALSNSAEEFVLISGVRTGKSLGIICFKKEDAETLLEQMKSMDPGMRGSSQVVAIALNKVFQLKVKGVAFRFIPDPSQIKNALKERQKAGFSEDGFSGVPVFQSRSLILKSQNKRYRPAFFRKEDLENSLLRASQQQNQLNPALKQGDIEVAVLEEIIQGMKEGSDPQWDDVVFIPPGFDISVDLPTQEKLTAMG